VVGHEPFMVLELLAGETLARRMLDAAGTVDRDKHSLRYQWFFYPEKRPQISWFKPVQAEAVRCPRQTARGLCREDIDMKRLFAALAPAYQRPLPLNAISAI